MKQAFYGVRGATLQLKQSWLKQDATKHWTTATPPDNKTVGEKLAPVVDAIIAKEIPKALIEYMESGEFGMSVRDNEVILRYWVKNDEASLLVESNLFDMLMDAMRESNETLNKPESNEMRAAILNGVRLMIAQANTWKDSEPAEVEPPPVQRTITKTEPRKDEDLSVLDNPFANLGFK